MFYKTTSSKQTKKFAGFLAGEILLARIKRKNALILALSGNLGSGKTTFVQGFLRAAGIRRKITSPTFVLIKNYKLKTENYKRAYHVDCYRINSDAQRGRSPDLAERRGNPKELSGLGLKEILNNPENIVLIEWPERIKKILPKDLIWIKFKHGEKENKRILKFKQ